MRARQYNLISLLRTMTYISIVLAFLVASLGLKLAVWLPLGLIAWELIQFGRDLNKPIEDPPAN